MSTTPATDHTPAWLEWLKKPENIMTGIVLAAGLTQDRSPGQSRMDQLGQTALGAMAFRGGLQQGVQAQNERERAFQTETEQRNRQLSQGDARIGLERQSMVDTNRRHTESITANKDLATQQHTNAMTLRGTPQAVGPEEAGLMKSQAGYYDRMPSGSKGSGKDPNAPDAYEEAMFKAWNESKANDAMMTGKPYVLDPAEWLQYIQPYRNAKVYLGALESQGVAGEVYKDDKGNWKVRVRGVQEPTGDTAPPGNPAPVELTPETTGVEAVQVDAKRKKLPDLPHGQEAFKGGKQVMDWFKTRKAEPMAVRALKIATKDGTAIPPEAMSILLKMDVDRLKKVYNLDGATIDRIFAQTRPNTSGPLIPPTEQDINSPPPGVDTNAWFSPEMNGRSYEDRVLFSTPAK